MDDERMRGDVVDQDVPVGLDPDGVAAGDGGLPGAAGAPQSHPVARKGLRRFRVRSGWGEPLLGLIAAGASLRHVMQAVDRHQPWWTGFHTVFVIGALTYAAFGVLKWCYPAPEAPAPRHGFDAHG
jgi:hypothetical protein